MNYKAQYFPPYVLSLLSGLLLGLSWSTYFPVLTLFIAFIPLLYMLYNYKLDYTSVFRYAFVSFFIFHLFVVWWLYKSSFFGFLAIIIINSSFMAFVFALIAITKQKLGNIPYYLSFVFYWLAFEYLHYYWEISWPFMNIGHWVAQKINIVQWYEYTGVLGGSLWILLINLFLFLFVDSIVKSEKRSVIVSLVIAIGVIVFPILYSINIYKFYNEEKETINVLIVQPNIDPYSEKYDSHLFNSQINMQIKLANDKIDNKTDYVIFPEASFPIYIDQDSIFSNNQFEKIRSLSTSNNNIKIVGGLYSYKIINKDTAFYNTSFQIDTIGNVSFYHKSKLVLGIEKMPFERYFKFLSKLNLDMGGYTNSLNADSTQKVFSSNIAEVAPIICYESVYNEYVAGFVEKGANVIFVITNDGWWGSTPGYYQHLLCSQIRAIETRRSVARSANTGISCLINQKGEIYKEIPSWTKSILRGDLNLNNKTTFFVKNGNIIGKISLFISIFFLIILIIKSRLI